MSSNMQSSRLARIGTVLAMIGAALGFGSIWRFPQQVATNGGLAFILIYVISGVLVAMPIFSIESMAGQLSRGTLFDGAYMTGNPKLLFAGTAFWGVLGIFSYYPTLLAYTGQYMIKSFDQPWYPNTTDFEVCGSYNTVELCEPSTPLLCPSTDYCICTWNPVKETCVADMFTYASGYLDTVTLRNLDFDSSDPQEGWGNITQINWTLYGIYLFNAIAVILAVIFGDKVLRWVSYLTLIPSFAIVLALFIYNFTLDGIGEGMHYYAGRFDASELVNVEVIRAAITQMVFAMSVGQGVIPVLAGMNSIGDTLGNPAWIVVGSATVFGLVSGCIVFCMLGYLAGQTGQMVSDGADGGLLGEGGAGLVFITYSSGISDIFDGGAAGGWVHLLFWMMMYIMGFTSLVSLAKGVIMIFSSAKCTMGIFGQCDKARGAAVYAVAATVLLCLMTFGLISCSDYGFFFITSIDHFVGNLILPAAVGSIGFIYTWMFNEEWYNRNYGKTLRRAQNMYFLFTMWLVSLNRFVFHNSTTIDYDWLVLSLIIPVIQPFVFALFLQKRNKSIYSEALDLAWNGSFGDVMDRVKHICNHDGKRTFGGGTYRHMAGLIRNLGVPVFFGLCVDTMCTSDFFFNYSPTQNIMPPWFALATVFFPLAYIGLNVLFLLYPDIAALFTSDAAEFSRGLFLNESYAFGIDLTGVIKDEGVVLVSRSSSSEVAAKLEVN